MASLNYAIKTTHKVGTSQVLSEDSPGGKRPGGKCPGGKSPVTQGTHSGGGSPFSKNSSDENVQFDTC